MPKISILIPVYNVEKYLSDCLNSCINQTMQDIEIICVNDGSTDHSLDILEQYASKDTRIKVISQENKGTLIVRKVAVAHATGEYTLFLDSDDWFELNACEKLYDAIQKYDVEILQFQCIYEYINEKYISNINYNTSFIKYEKISGREAFSYILHHPFGFYPWGKIIKTTLLKEIYASVKDIYMLNGEDTYINHPLLYIAKSYYGIAESYYHYRRGSSFNSKGEYTLENFTKAQYSNKNSYDCIKNFFDNHEYNEADSLQIKKNLLCRQSWATYWCSYDIMFPNSEAFDLVIDIWGIDVVLSQMANIYDTLEKQAKLAQSLQGSKKLAKKPLHNIHTIATYISNLRNGGAERATVQSMNYWLELGYKVIIFTDELPQNDDYPYSQEVIRITLPQNFSERFKVLQESIKKYNIDIMIHSDHWDNNLFWHLCLFKSCNIPFIVYHASIFVLPWDKLIAPFDIHCDAILVLSRVDQLYYSAYTKTLFYPKPLLIDMPEYNTLPHNTKPVILWLARLSTVKRYTHAILIIEKVIQQIPDAQLLIVGSSPNGQAELELQSMIQKKNLENNVHLYGHSKHVEEYYKQASIFLMTSAYEGFPNTIIEARAWGIPIVHYDLPYCESFRKFKGHICVPQEDIQGAANAIISLLQNPDKLIALGNEGRESLETYLKNNDFKEQWHQIFVSLENPQDMPEVPEDTRILINTFSEHYFKSLQDKEKLQKQLSKTREDSKRQLSKTQNELSKVKKQLQPLQPFRTHIPAYDTLETALVGFHAHFPFLFRIFSFIIRRSYSVFFSLKNYGVIVTLSKICKFFIRRLKKVLHLS